jgi:predicted O-methyltransferase YrrM
LFNENKKFYFENYETYIYNDIKDDLLKSKCSIMWGNQREFLNGIIRKYRPKKILELGVLLGGSSIIILNAIKDIKNSHLYSIDIGNSTIIGSCAQNSFSYLTNKWTLFKGNIAAKYIEKIGKNIDFALIDTSHFEPGEILDFLMILPFLKEEAIIIFHDIDNQITDSKGKNMRYYWAPYIIFNLIRGKKFYPSGPGVLNKDIGAIKLEKNQKRFIHDYCRALGGHWEYFLAEEHIQIIKSFFEKYYDKECLIILNEALSFNKGFVKDNPIEPFYDRLSKKK